MLTSIGEELPFVDCRFGQVFIDDESMSRILGFLGSDIPVIPYRNAPCWMRVSKPGQFEDNRFGPFNFWSRNNDSSSFIGTMYVCPDKTLFLHPEGSNLVTREDNPGLQHYFGDWLAPRLVENMNLQGTSDLIMSVVVAGQ